MSYVISVAKEAPHYDTVQLFMIPQTLYSPSEEEKQFLLSDRLSFQRFVGIGFLEYLRSRFGADVNNNSSN